MNDTRERRFVLWMLTPALLFYVVLVAVPGARALLFSLRKWDGLGEPEWAGLANFRVLLADELFLAALRHNAILFFGAGGITIGLALLFAALMHRRIRGAGLFRVAFFFPNVIATVAVAVLWVLLYSTTEFGLVNAVLEQLATALGMPYAAEHLPFPFTDSRYLIWSLIPMMVWTAVGFYMVLFLAAMQSIPESYYEAARLDGAGPVQQFVHVTLPMIREILLVGVVFFLISSAKLFDSVWVMENQYPTKDSHVMATLLYQKIFTEYDVGYGAAVAVLLFAIVLAGTLVVFRLNRREVLEY